LHLIKTDPKLGLYDPMILAQLETFLGNTAVNQQAREAHK